MYNSTIKNKRGICPECRHGKETPLIGGKCSSHYWANKSKINREKRGIQEQKPRVTIDKLSKKGQKVAAEDRKFFKQIWNERPHYSEISGKHLGEEYNPVFFSHILSKGAYTALRHEKGNILLMNFNEHENWGNGDRRTLEFKTTFKRA